MKFDSIAFDNPRWIDIVSREQLFDDMKDIIIIIIIRFSALL